MVLAAATWPDRRGWVRVAALSAAGLPAVAAVAWAAGLAGWRPVPLATAIPVAATLIVVPALGEELLFRALLVPRPGEPASLLRLAWPVAAFTAWHPLQAWTVGPPWAGAFLQPGFLLAAALLGALLVAVFRLTGSLWPCVLVHWIAVAAWKLLLAGPF